MSERAAGEHILKNASGVRRQYAGDDIRDFERNDEMSQWKVIEAGSG